ncbi:MAG: hypothetical protein JWN00_3491 [Actinomycetia bacterium]|nr:hypothetical protein [Actinomycetes bacterium]
MTAVLDLVIPAGSALIGAVVGGAATIGSQWLTQRGTYKRDREARRDTFQARQFEIERDTLLALQDAVTAQSLTWSRFVNGDLPVEERATDSDLLDGWREVLKLAHRARDRNAADAALAFCVVANRADLNPHGERQNIINAFGDAQRALGIALRRDPYESA